MSGINKKHVEQYMKYINFYKASLVKKYLRTLQKSRKETDKKYKDFKVRCPICNCNKIDVEYSDCEYSSEHWFICQNDHCGFLFEDEVGLKDMLEDLMFCDFDGIHYLACDSEENLNYGWNSFCEKEMMNVINNTSEDQEVF